MEEYSRIVIKEYCRKHNSKKSERLRKLVVLSYDVTGEGSDSDTLFLERAIASEKDKELKEALMDLDLYLFKY